MTKDPRLSTEELRMLYTEKAADIRARLQDFANIRKDQYFYELVYCLLTPQSKALNAGKAVHMLQENEFAHRNINPEPFLHRKEFYIRFHKTKGKYLVAAKERFPVIAEHLCMGTAGQEILEWLTKNVSGIGWKEASHFLRNIGHRNLAILDRHILKNLVRVGVLPRLPKTLTPRQYAAIEKKFLKFGARIGISIDELDLLFWSMETGKILK